MAQPKTLTELLKSQPVEDVEALAGSLRGEISRLQEELRFVEDSLSGRRRSRRRRRTSEPDTTAGRPPRQMKREDIVPIVESFGRPVWPAEVTQRLHDRGLDVSSNAVRTNMARLVTKDGLLVREQDGRYSAASAANGNGSGDSLFRDLDQVRESAS
jgi:hypothetical protein